MEGEDESSPPPKKGGASLCPIWGEGILFREGEGEENKKHSSPREGRPDTCLNGESPLSKSISSSPRGGSACPPEGEALSAHPPCFYGGGNPKGGRPPLGGHPLKKNNRGEGGSASPLDIEGTLKEGNPVPNRIQPRKQPGLYMIRCTQNDWRYYGESSNVSGRLSSHKSILTRKIHANYLLQADWNKFGCSCFEFHVLYMGPQWEDASVRRGKELELIVLDRTLCYNIVESASRPGEQNPFFGRVHTEETKRRIGDAMRGVPKDSLGRQISINGQVYASIAEASRQTTHSRKLIRDRVNDSAYPDWKSLS